MKPLEQGQIIKEIFEERKIVLELTTKELEKMKEMAETEKQKTRYDILIVETKLCLEFVTNTLEKTNKVLEIYNKIENDHLSVSEKMKCMVEVMEIMSDL